MSKKYLSFLILYCVCALTSNAQTNNFWTINDGYPSYGFSFDKAGDIYFVNDLKTFDVLAENGLSMPRKFALSDWQGIPLLYNSHNGFYVYPKNIKIKNSDGLNSNIGGHKASIQIINCDTSRYIFLYTDFSNSKYHTTHGHHPGFGPSQWFFKDIINLKSNFHYSIIDRDVTTESGFEIKEEYKNRKLEPSGFPLGVMVTRDTFAQPVFVIRTLDGFYSYKTLPGGDVVLLDSFKEYFFQFTPQAILHADTGYVLAMNAHQTINHSGNQIVYTIQYEVRNQFGKLTPAIAENHRALFWLEFDKHTGKFNSQTAINQHNFYYGELNMDSLFSNVSKFFFSPDDEYLYFLQSEHKYTPHIQFGLLNRPSFYDSEDTYLIQMKMGNSNFEKKQIFKSPNLPLLNHKGQLIFTESGSNSTGILNKINFPNKPFPDCDIQKDIIKSTPVNAPDNFSINNFFGLAQSYLPRHFDFLRVEQEYTYSCSATVQLKNTSLPDIGFTKYKWHIKDENDSLMVFEQFEPPPLTYNQNGNYAVQLFAQSPKGGGYGEWYIDTIRVRIPAKPVARFSASDTVVCQHLPVTFTNLSSDQQTHSPRTKEYVWNFGDGNTSMETSPTHTYSQPGVYSVSLHFSNGYCDSLLVKTNYIHVVDAPKPGFEISDTQGCAPLPVTITDTTWFRVQSKEYYFSDIDQWLPMTQNTFNHTFQNAGAYRVVQKLTGTSGCVIVTDSVWIHVSTGITLLDTSSIHLVDVLNPWVNITWKKHPAAVDYTLFAGNNLNNMSLLTQTPDTFFAHSIASAQFYQVQAADSCGNKSTIGHYAKPVWLQGSVRGNNLAAELQHTPYEIWTGNEKQYLLQKFVLGNWITLRNNNSALPYQDIAFIETDSLQSCYRIQIIDPNESSILSHSNVLCLEYIPLIFFPNAFSPNADGLNDDFELQTTGIASYTLQIYNRWGQKVFEGNNGGWNGQFMGKPAPAGVYMIHIHYTTKNGDSFETSNTMQLVR